MKHMFLKSITALFFSLAILATSCKKGDTGAQGEQGEQGETGATGSTGKTGSANVIYSGWIDASFEGYNDSTAIAEIDAAKLTDSILNYGDIKVYWNANTASTPYVVSLPYADNGMFLGVDDLYLNFVAVSGSIYLLSNYDLSSGTDATYGDYWQYRYVLIPGGTAARTAVDWNDYKQVQKYLGLKD